METLKRIYLTFFVLLFSIVVTTAQETCDAIIQQAVETASENCDGLRRNEACYGNITIDAEAAPDVEDFVFDVAGDIANVSDIASMRLSSQVEDSGAWGISIMQVPVITEDGTENAQFVLFGDVALSNKSQTQNEAIDEGAIYGPMQAIEFEVFNEEISDCGDITPSGLLIQTPDGIGRIEVEINEVNIKLGSTIFIRAVRDQLMTIDVLEGSAIVTANQATVFAIAGLRVEIPLSATLFPSDPPIVVGYDELELPAQPLTLMGRTLEVADNLETFEGTIETGEWTYYVTNYVSDCDSPYPSGESESTQIDITVSNPVGYFSIYSPTSFEQLSDNEWEFTAPFGQSYTSRVVVPSSTFMYAPFDAINSDGCSYSGIDVFIYNG